MVFRLLPTVHPYTSKCPIVHCTTYGQRSLFLVYHFFCLVGYLLRWYLWWLSLAVTNPSFAFANLVTLFHASSCPIQYVLAESARSAGKISKA